MGKKKLVRHKKSSRQSGSQGPVAAERLRLNSKIENLLSILKNERQRQWSLVRAYYHNPDVNRNAVTAFQFVFNMELPDDTDIRRRVSNAVNKLVAGFQKQGLIRVRLIEPDGDLTELEPSLGDRIRQKFGLRDVWVVNMDRIRAQRKSDEEEEDDLVHAGLGNWASRMLSTLIREDDVIGVGSGRALLNVGRAFKSVYRFHGCKAVCALTGNMNVGVWRDTGTTRTVDADDNAKDLHVALQSGGVASLKVLDAAITEKNPTTEAKLSEIHMMTKIAVVGIGALASSHQLRKSLLKEKIAPELAGVEAELRFLDEFAMNYDNVDGSDHRTQAHNHFVLDVCNWLFINNRLDTTKVDPAELTRLRAVVEAVNERFLNTPPQILADVCERGAVIAVAGGQHKAGAIASVLLENRPGGRWQRPFISHLVTDDLNAWKLQELNPPARSVQINASRTANVDEPGEYGAYI